MLLYYLLIPFIYLLAYVPTKALFRLINPVAFLLQNIVGYRKKVVQQNLEKSFPLKTKEERQAIEKRFYKILVERILEGIKTFTVSKTEIRNRCTVENIEVVEKLYSQKRNVVVVLGHCGSWEWACLIASILVKHNRFAIYTELSNHRFNRTIKASRERFGMKLVSMTQTPFHLKHGFPQPWLCHFLTDQTHSNPKRGYWTNFLNQDTCFMTGAARFAIQHNAAMIYVKVKETKRGHFSIEVVPLSETPTQSSEAELTQLFVNQLEKQIIENPADWLWSHNRWKHKR